MSSRPELEGVRYLTPDFPAVGLNPKRVIPHWPSAIVDHMRVFIVPAGIGDIAWCLSKLCSLGDDNFALAVADAALGTAVSQRALPFLSLVEKVAYVGGALCTSPQVCWASAHSSVMQGLLPIRTPAYLSVNPWLESGRKLDDFLPSLRTVRGFTLRRPEEAEREADMFLNGGDGAFAVYTSSTDYFGQNLPLAGWVNLILALAERSPHSKIVLIGASWDISLLLPVEDALQAAGLGDRVILVYDRPFSTALALLRRCDFLIGAASGLGIVAEYQGVPTVHLYPPALYEGPEKKAHRLMGTWESPSMVASGESLSLELGHADASIPIENTQARVDRLVQAVFTRFAPFGGQSCPAFAAAIR